MSKEITEQAKLQAGSVKSFKVSMKTLPPYKGHDGEPMVMIIESGDIEIEMRGLEKSYDPFTWYVLEFGNNIT